MCTLALFFQNLPHYPLVLAANRDESLSRPSTPPTKLWSSPWIFGGRDQVAGGTWLGINEKAMVACILNRKSLLSSDPQKRSRGQLCLEVLKRNSLKDALAFLSSQNPKNYNPFNLLLASPQEAYVAYGTPETLILKPLTPGTYLLTNLNLNDPHCPRIRHFYQSLTSASQLLDPSGSLEPFFSYLHRILSTHSPSPTNPQDQAGLCLHMERYGTRSSSLVAYIPSSQNYRFLFAPGPPCQEGYQEVLLPPREGKAVRVYGKP